MNQGRYRLSPQLFSGILPLGLICLLLLSNSGCVGLLAAILRDTEYAPAKFKGLEEKKVAVLCVAGPSFYSENSTSRQLAEQVESQLVMHVDEIKIIPQQKIDDWKDVSGWDNMDYREAGKSLKADMVIAIDLARFEIQPNPGVYKGTAEFVVSVYDINHDGKLVFQDTPSPVEFPLNGLASEVSSERQFRNSFLRLLSHRISRNFYKYNVREDLMLDQSFVSN
ncbi:hypothetical protein ACYFX5_06195 [Bremerella sp. T1]|uniref:hypothetical protein n=1 Tax=Bremerella sp. TYQ1 TaxID=3119568 RepID=UPI001CCA4ABC|nr:hypothetical protein [Bremerella volcania]UBM37850.1 hypothetical protein LA756_08135 [Bremerella volcania]